MQKDIQILIETKPEEFETMIWDLIEILKWLLQLSIDILVEDIEKRKQRVKIKLTRTFEISVMLFRFMQFYNPMSIKKVVLQRENKQKAQSHCDIFRQRGAKKSNRTYKNHFYKKPIIEKKSRRRLCHKI